MCPAPDTITYIIGFPALIADWVSSKKKVEPPSSLYAFWASWLDAPFTCVSRPQVTTAQEGKLRESTATTPPHPDVSFSARSSVATGRVRRMCRTRALLTLGSSLACLTTDMIAPIFLPVNDHDTTTAA